MPIQSSDQVSHKNLKKYIETTSRIQHNTEGQKSAMPSAILVDNKVHFDGIEDMHADRAPGDLEDVPCFSDLQADYEDEVDGEKSGLSAGNADAASTRGSIMMQCVSATQERLKKELNANLKMEERNQWLKKYLEKNECWIRKNKAFEICKKIGLECEESGYYRDIKVWLPDVELSKVHMPACVTCKSTDSIEPHCWPDWPGRRVITLDSCHQVMTKRYICTDCKKRAEKMKEGKENGVDEPPQCTFVGWDALLEFKK